MGAVDVGLVEVVERYRVREGDRLSLIALKWYGDPSAWRRIAAANAISPSDKLRLGRVLVIPRQSE